MLEQSKAKHDAMVSQAQTNQSAYMPGMSPYAQIENMHHIETPIVVDMDPAKTNSMNLMPKPPVQPSYKRSNSGHRGTR